MTIIENQSEQDADDSTTLFREYLSDVSLVSRKFWIYVDINPLITIHF